jgi:hypothetical protein
MYLANRYLITCLTILVMALVLTAGCDENTPTLPPTVGLGGFLGATFIQHQPSPVVVFPGETLKGNWQNDCSPGSPQGSAQPWVDTSNFEGAIIVVNGRTCATWFISAENGPCIGLGGNVFIKQSVPYNVTVTSLCQISPQGVPIIASDDPTSVYFYPFRIFNQNPSQSPTVSAVIPGSPVGFTSTYGMPLFQYFDSSGTLIAQEYATSVTIASDGTSATGPMPSNISQAPPGVYVGLAKNATASGTYSVLGEGAITVLSGTGQPPPPPPPPPCKTCPPPNPPPQK